MRTARWLVAAVACGALVVNAGCSRPAAKEISTLQAENESLKRQVSELQGQVSAGPSTAQPAAVNLIDPNYPPGVAGTSGWEYYKSASADLDGDGTQETVHVTTNAAWDAKSGQFGWDDGHPWHVYVEEPDGTRTYLFSRWVQLSRLDVMVTEPEPTVLILQTGGAGVSASQVRYLGPGKVEAVTLMQAAVLQYASFAEGSKYRE